jgi:hypothetical protein
MTPGGASQMSPGFLHLYVAEQTWGELGLKPGGYTGTPLLGPEEMGTLGIIPA